MSRPLTSIFSVAPQLREPQNGAPVGQNSARHGRGVVHREPLLDRLVEFV